MIVYHHIYKNGGTTVWNRYRNNPGAWLVPGHEHMHIPTQGYQYIDSAEIKVPIQGAIDYLHCRIAPGVLEQEHDNVQYYTTLRDPVHRLVSGFNFWKKINHMNISFPTWLKFAKNCWSDPPLFMWQYEWFIRHDRYWGPKFDKAVHYPKSEQKIWCDIAVEICSKNYTDILFLDENYEDKLPNIFQSLHCENPTQHSNTTTQENMLHVYDNAVYTSMQDIDISLATDYLEYEIMFYARMKKIIKEKEVVNV